MAMISFVLYCVLFGILVFCPKTDTGNFIWKEPPPTQIVKATRDPVKHFSDKQLFEGTINATLTWHFGSTELNFKSLIIRFERKSVARISSSVTGTPPDYVNRFGLDWIPNQNLVKLVIFNVTTEDNGTFSCQVTADSLDGFSDYHFTSNVRVDVVGPPRNIITSSNQTITAPAELTLNCSAVGKPEPTITWRRVSDNTVVIMPLTIIPGDSEESYRCIADNGVGNPLTKDVIVNILFPPKVTLAEKFFVGRGEAASLICLVEGNPMPTISWSHCDVPNVLCDKQYLNISKVQTARAIYNCTARNAVGVDSATTVLIIGGYNIYVRMKISGQCSRKDSLWEPLQKEFNSVFANTQSYSKAELIHSSCGSLIFDVVLKFRTEVPEDEIISTIQTAIVDGKLGNLSANISSIIGIPPVEQTSTSAPTSTVPKPDAGPPWAIIGGVVGGVVVLAIVIGVLRWWVNKQRKCRKDTKIHNSDLEGHRANAQSGPRAGNGTDGAAEQEREVAAAIPTFAVVDKKSREEVPPVHADFQNSGKPTVSQQKEDSRKGQRNTSSG